MVGLCQLTKLFYLNKFNKICIYFLRMALLPPDPLFILRSDMGGVQCLELMFTENSNHLLAGTEQGFIYFWNLKTHEVVKKQKVGASIEAIHYVMPYIITQEATHRIRLWHVKTNFTCILLKEYWCQGTFCQSIIINSCLILPADDSNLEAIHTRSFNTVRVYVPIKETLRNAMALQKATVAGRICVLAGYESGGLVLFHFLSGSQLSYIELRENITSIAFDSVTGRGVCGNYSNRLQIFTIDEKYNIKLKSEKSSNNPGCNVVRLRPDRKILACCGWDGNLKLYSWESLGMLVTLNQHNNSVTDVIFSEHIVPECNSNIMAVSGGDGSISIWNLYNHNH